MTPEESIDTTIELLNEQIADCDRTIRDCRRVIWCCYGFILAALVLLVVGLVR